MRSPAHDLEVACRPSLAPDGDEPLDLADVIATGDTPLPKEYAACKDIGSF